MDEINIVFYTDWHTDGYQLGLNIFIDKGLSEKEYCNIHEKLGFIFKNFKYGMDIAKITEVTKTVLINEGIKEEEISTLRISLVNKNERYQTDNITIINKGVLPNDIYEYELFKDHEVYSIKYVKNKLTQFYHQNLEKQFIYNDNRFQIDCKDLPENTRKRNGALNKFIKVNMEMIKQLENIDITNIYTNINLNDSILISAYSIFYNEMPDFNDPNIMAKFQCMAAILHTTVFSMVPSISKNNYRDCNITAPESVYIREQLFKLNILLGNDFNKIETFNFKTHIAEKIKFIGETIRNYMNNLPEEDRVAFLNQFAINYLHTYSNHVYKSVEKIDTRSQELMRLLIKYDGKN